MSYLNGHADREFIEELPRFRLPMLGAMGGTFRAFEITGDAMLPITSGTTIVGRYVESWHTIAQGVPCIIVTQHDGILFRRVFMQGPSVALRCDNPLHPSTEVRTDDVLEIWEAKSYISSAFPVGGVSLDNLASLVLDLQQKVQALKR